MRHEGAFRQELVVIDTGFTIGKRETVAAGTVLQISLPEPGGRIRREKASVGETF
jgi:hypothetical protein